MRYDEHLAKELVAGYKLTNDPSLRNRVMADLRNMCWPLFRWWLSREFPNWFPRDPDYFEECFDQALMDVVDEYDPARGTTNTFLTRRLWCKSIDALRKLEREEAKEQPTPNEQMDVYPARPDPDRSLIALGQAMQEEDPACAALLELRIDPLMPSRGFYSEAAKVLAEGHGVRTEGAWRQVMDENKKHILKFLQDRGFSLKDLE